MATSGQTRPAAAAVIVVALVAAVGGWWWTNRETGPRLGDYGRVTATVDVQCSDVEIDVEGLALRRATIGRLPEGWIRAGEVVGNLELTDRSEGDGQEGVEGTFTADDGVEIDVQGGRSGEYMFTPACPIWSDQPTG